MFLVDFKHIHTAGIYRTGRSYLSFIHRLLRMKLVTCDLQCSFTHVALYLLSISMIQKKHSDVV